MKANEVRELSDEDLRDRVNELQEQNFRLRFKLALGNVDTVKQIRANRKDLARVKTILRERDLSAGK
jgi:large subunit ribosomal protein L29